MGFTADGGGFERQHDPELAEQATHAVDQRSALFRITVAGPVHEQARLLLDGLDVHKAQASAASFLPRLPRMR